MVKINLNPACRYENRILSKYVLCPLDFEWMNILMLLSLMMYSKNSYVVNEEMNLTY